VTTVISTGISTVSTRPWPHYPALARSGCALLTLITSWQVALTLTEMPTLTHQFTQPKTRAPRLNNPTVEITRAGQKYSGNLEIVDSGSSTPAFKRPKTDDVVINGRRYRVPERVVILDFWSKLSRNGGNKYVCSLTFLYLAHVFCAEMTMLCQRCLR
jgi:hypothetical protein